MDTHSPITSTLVKATCLIVTLAALDIVGSYAAKEWSRGRLAIGLSGVLSFVLLYLVYAASLRYAELSMVTFGWIVLVEIGVLLLDHFRYQAQITPKQWVAIAGLMLIQTYLMVSSAPPASTQIIDLDQPSVAIAEV